MTAQDQADIAGLADAYLRELRDVRLAYKPAEAARLLGVDERTVQRLIASGELHAVRRSSRLTLIPRDSIYAFLGLETPVTNVQVIAL